MFSEISLGRRLSVVYSSNFCFARLLSRCKVFCMDLELILLDMSGKGYQIRREYIKAAAGICVEECGVTR